MGKKRKKKAKNEDDSLANRSSGMRQREFGQSSACSWPFIINPVILATADALDIVFINNESSTRSDNHTFGKENHQLKCIH
ncbi:hypothetical protein OUZ56_007648 [Daphnia magna]|uniref:Uncharacterized protein n=1 Tax=Daphnia magna TaxID=35525 RepID=A0ABR0AB08_9CRUS|nr:hypothetical protein OUZ56_007648 [Daphnia magna]